LKITPKQAQVYVDGSYAGTVDDFNGRFHRLHLGVGSHRIEVRADGYQPLVLDVRIMANHTTTFEGALQPVP